MNKRPHESEYAAFYHTYVSLVPEGQIAEQLNTQKQETLRLLEGLTEEQAAYRYAPEKWTIKEVLGHLMDTERVFAYRLLSIARGDTTPLPGFDENSYVQNAHFDEKQLSDLLEQYRAVRQASIALLKTLNEQDWLRQGMANNHVTSVSGLAYIMAGHELHHHRILQERYFQDTNFPN